MRTDNTTVYTFSEVSYSNLSLRIKLIDVCTRMDKTIYSSMKIQVELVDNHVITYHLGMFNHTFVPCIDNKRKKMRKT